MVIVSTNRDGDEISTVTIAIGDTQFEIIDIGNDKIKIFKLDNLKILDELIIIPSSSNAIIIR